MSFQREHVQNVTLTYPVFASQELQAKHDDANREALNALPSEAILAAEAAAAKVVSASNETFMISSVQRAVNQLIPLSFLPVSYYSHMLFSSSCLCSLVLCSGPLACWGAVSLLRIKCIL